MSRHTPPNEESTRKELRVPQTATSQSELAINGGSPVSTSNVPFMSPKLTQADIDAAVEVLHSGMLRQATKCAELESRMGQLSDAKHALTCANGTCALQLAYGLFPPGHLRRQERRPG